MRLLLAEYVKQHCDMNYKNNKNGNKKGNKKEERNKEKPYMNTNISLVYISKIVIKKLDRWKNIFLLSFFA